MLRPDDPLTPRSQFSGVCTEAIVDECMTLLPFIISLAFAVGLSLCVCLAQIKAVSISGC